MNNSKLVKRLRTVPKVQCRYWSTCGASDCIHYDSHIAGKYTCINISPVRYCGTARGFVYDIPADEISFDQECDPNVAFKAKKQRLLEVDDATARHYQEWREASGMANGDTVDDGEDYS